MKIVFISALIVALDAEYVPVWHEGQCGMSRYPDAGFTSNTQSSNSYGIYGGRIARPHELPWLVGLVPLSQKPRPVCGGAIINQRWIVTAAHCIKELQASSKLEGAQIVVGEHNLTAANPDRKYHNVSLFITHENYHLNATGSYYDVAMLKLTTNITMSENVRPVCAPGAEKVYYNRTGLIVGWGHINAFENSNVLRIAMMKIIRNSECEFKGIYSPGTMPDNQLCATDEQGDTVRSPCYGDSGGPLIVKNESGHFAMVGIISANKGGCAGGYPPIFMRVSAMIDWIAKTILDNQ